MAPNTLIIGGFMKRVWTEYEGVFYIPKINGDKTYYIMWKHLGKQHQRRIGTESAGITPKLANKIRAEILANIELGKTPFEDELRASKLTFYDLSVRFIQWAKVNKKSWQDDCLRLGIDPATLQAKNDIRRPVAYFGNIPINRLTSDKINQYASFLQGQLNNKGEKFSAQTIKHHLIVIRRVFNFAIESGIFQGLNPADSKRVKMPKVRNTLIRYLNDDEVKAIVEVIQKLKPKNFISCQIIMFAMATGMRKSEILELKWVNVDFKNSRIKIEDAKSGKDEYIPISENAKKILLETERVSGQFEFVFSDDGKQRKDIVDFWEKVKKMAGIERPFRFHDLRHHFATSLINSGVDISTVQKALTHKDITTSLKYAHLKTEQVKEAIDKVQIIPTETVKLRRVK